MFRVRCSVPIEAPPRVRLEGAALHHVRVARVAVGETVEVFDGEGRAWRGALERLEPDAAWIRLEASLPPTALRRVTLLQGLPKGDKLEWVLQKATELGVSAVWPVTTERSVVRLAADAAEGRRARWQRIAEEAARQCGRADVPEVALPVTLEAAARALTPGTRLLVLDEEERAVRLSDALAMPAMRSGRPGEASDPAATTTAHAAVAAADAVAESVAAAAADADAISGPAVHAPVDSAAEGAAGRARPDAAPADAAWTPVALVVGPEGGLSRAEVARLVSLGGTAVTLGSRVLRTETAALAALAILRHLDGALG